ncbi:hypothetical protein [Leptospira kmetyi]|uniref:hypothetical protein n=1 Tax=Leptospira kmetyi TaxID=408139 RepID=UPI001FAEA900|nr:hypothetical protein [Leptospira kmetyi]
MRTAFLEAMEEGFRNEAKRKILDGGRFFTVRSKKTKLLCFASLILEEGEVRSYQVVRYKDQRIKWVSYEELLKDFDLIDSDPKPCPIDWILPAYRQNAVSDEKFRKLLNQESEMESVETNVKMNEKSA